MLLVSEGSITWDIINKAFACASVFFLDKKEKNRFSDVTIQMYKLGSRGLLVRALDLEPFNPRPGTTAQMPLSKHLTPHCSPVPGA